MKIIYYSCASLTIYAELVMSDNVAVLKGYTKSVMISGGDRDIAALVKPDTDYDDIFTCYDTDNQEWVKVYGYNCEIEELAS